MDILKFKDYEGSCEIDVDGEVCFGKILFINDLVSYEAETPKQLKKEFELAVEDYIETCKALGIEAKKPLKGQFNVRVSPELHKSAALRALADGTSLNDVVNSALDFYLHAAPEV